MKILPCFLTAALLTALPLQIHAKIERVIEKSFAVQPGGLLTIETSGGDVRVQPGDGDKVHVVARQKIRTNSEADADKLLEKLELSIEQSGNDVKASAKYAKRTSSFSFVSWPPVAVSFEVTVPATYHANIRTSGGDIFIGDLSGNMAARTSGGDVSLGKISGDVFVSTSGGDISLTESTGPAKLGTSGGDILVARVLAPADLSTSGGDITIGSVEGSLKAQTSGGDVIAAIKGALAGDSSLGTSGGNIEVTVDRSAGFELDASTSGGDVGGTGLAITIERGGIGKTRLTGRINGGGPRLKLRTSGGDIDITAR